MMPLKYEGSIQTGTARCKAFPPDLLRNVAKFLLVRQKGFKQIKVRLSNTEASSSSSNQ